MTLPLNYPAFRIEHPSTPGIVFGVYHTEEQGQTELVRLLEQEPGFMLMPNNESAAAPIVEAPKPPDTLDLLVGELVLASSSRDDAYDFLKETIHLADGVRQAEKIEAARKAALPAAAEPPALPEKCPFQLGNMVIDGHSEISASVQEIDDAAGFMVVVLPDHTPHKVPALCYEYYALHYVETPAAFFIEKPKAESIPAPAAKPAPARAPLPGQMPKRNPADLLKSKPAG